MFLTRLRLDSMSRTSQRLLADPYRLHQVILLAFDPTLPGGDQRVLFRVEPEARDGFVPVLVQSHGMPNWSAPRVAEVLPEFVVDGPKPLKLTLAAGQTLRFRVRANPTKRAPDGKRIGIFGEQEQVEWVRRKFEEGGFALGGCRHRDEGMVRSRRPKGDGPEMTFLSVLYDGVVRVTDPERALATIACGIGTAKAFGFGLLSVART